MHQNNIDALATRAVEIALRAAREYMAQRNLTADPDTLRACLKSWLRVQLPEALVDAREAIECGMHQAASATFALSIARAGIEAAKESSMPSSLAHAKACAA